MIDAVGLEACGDLIAQATPEQLSHIFDLDLWRSPKPGVDEQFNVDRFGEWIAVMADAGDEVAAAKLAGMPLPQLIAGFAHHLRVFDLGAVVEFETTDGDRWDYSRPVRGRTGIELGGYHIAATRETDWDAMAAVLVALETHHQDRFHELMREVRSRSHAARERDGFHALLEDRDQMMFDVATERERRRRERGFVSPEAARAFLNMSRSVTPASIVVNPMAREYRRSIVTTTTTPVENAADSGPEEAAAVELLAEAGIVTMGAPRALLGSGEADTSSRLERELRVVFERDPVAYGERNFELAYLANVLLAGCSIQSRPFTTAEATDAATAICNLGLETLSPAADYLIANDVIGVFQVGWTVLHEEVCVFAARRLIEVLADLRVPDEDTQSALNMLRVRLSRAVDAGEPWRAAGALDALTCIDLPAWAALCGLIAECPVIHAGLIASIDRSVRSVDPHAVEFISTRDQLMLVRTFTSALPARLS